MGSERRDPDSAAEGLELEQTVANIASAFFASESLGLQRAIEDVEQDIRAVELKLEQEIRQERQELRSVEQSLRQEINELRKSRIQWLELILSTIAIVIALLSIALR